MNMNIENSIYKLKRAYPLPSKKILQEILKIIIIKK